MKKIILFILLGFLVANAQPGQSRYQGRTGYQQSIIWNDLHKSLQDSIRNIIGDSANANIINFLEDSLTASNGIIYSGRTFIADTAFIYNALSASNGIVYSGRDFSADTTFLATWEDVDSIANARVADSLTIIRQEISDSIAANEGQIIQSGLVHEWKYTTTNNRNDTLFNSSQVGTNYHRSVGRAYNSYTSIAPLRKWTYLDLGWSFGDDKWTVDNITALNYTGNFAIETAVFFNDDYTRQNGTESIILIKGLAYGPGGNTNNYSLAREETNGYLMFKYKNVTERECIDTTTVLEAKTWYHIAVNVDTVGADSVHFFVNGTATGSYAMPAALTTNAHGLFIGGDYNNWAYSFFGQILFVRIYSTQLSEDDWNDNYQVARNQWNTSYMQDYTEQDAFFNTTRPIYPDSASGTNTRELVALYSQSEDSFRVYYSNTTGTSIDMAASADTLQSVESVRTLFSNAAVPYLFYDTVAADTLWIYWQKWTSAPHTADTVIYRAYSVDYGVTFAGTDTAYAGTPSANNYVIDPVVWLDGSTYKLIFTHNQRFWIATATKPGNVFANPQQITDVTPESGIDISSVMEGGGLDYINGEWVLFYTVGPTNRQYIRYATNSNLTTSGWTKGSYPLRFVNGYKRHHAYSLMHFKKLLVIGTSPFDSNWNYYCFSAADDSTGAGTDAADYYRLILAKKRNNLETDYYFDNIK